MVLIGISILIASLSFFFYKNPPSSWSFVTWFGPQVFGRHGKQSITRQPRTNEKSEKEDVQEDKVKVSLDCKAMPPPLLLSPRVSSSSTDSITPTTFNASAASSPSLPPTFELDDSPLPSSPVVFPAQNSIQRASGSRLPPSLRPLPVAQPPLRSINSSMPLPCRSPLPNRSPMSLAPPPRPSAIPPKPRLKVQLSPGHSQLDWAHISNRPGANLRGLPPSTPYLRVPTSLLRQYTGRKGKDAWTVLGGKVYNITPYLPYHPGGEPELMKAAGRDGTKLFGEVHPWVNWEGMLEPCLIGVLVGQEFTPRSVSENMD